ncbi:MAG: bifunctional UDP-N-acetylglucosamine diphosphorylase/glucosamine-1-phosphate N-acetyltransferase GlmU, partial [Burkholderiaceae bacterium]|nr:bifunctional UDP-N-acetylglucosamine diphosphorylase/glucosamine-1-phosphate N-acetyltransferase GlmU [Burkholderiaceae bacterium]
MSLKASVSLNKPLDVVVMAAGKGTRMRSQRPKVLHLLAERALLDHVLDTAQGLGARHVVVVTGHEGAQVQTAVQATERAQAPVRCVAQSPQLGTGHAVLQAMPALTDDGMTLVLSGDVPLTTEETLRALVAKSAGTHLALLTVQLPQPTGYGRILRDAQDAVTAIREEKDANDAERRVTEVYSGIMAVPTAWLRGALDKLTNNNQQGEYYLTDVVAQAVADGLPVQTHCIQNAWEVAGVNSAAQLAALERIYQRNRADALLDAGVRLADPARFDVRGELVCGQDVEIDVNCIFSGCVRLGDGVRVGAHCVIANADIAAGAVIHPFTHIDGEATGVQVGEGALVGPFARLRPGARLGRDVHIGNFVEVKNSTLADGAKANHLAYLGDAEVGERVNYGAGSITANYDGANKHKTVIEADVHVGSNCVLVAPITIGAGGTVGGGSTLTKSTVPGALTVARGKPVSIANWQRP